MTNSPESKDSEAVSDNAAVPNAGDRVDSSGSPTDDENYDNVVYRNPVERPVYKLSVNLIDTYKFINKVSFRQYFSAI